MKTIRALLLSTVLLPSACETSEAAQPPPPVASATITASVAAEPTVEVSVERGRYIVSTAGCHDCHTPWTLGPSGPEPDMTRALSGHPADMELPPPPAPTGPWITAVTATNTAWAGPWGISYTANLTSDEETGLGAWTEQMFVDTIRNGRHMAIGRPLLPPMPYPVYAQLTDTDLRSVFAYLQTVPAISNRVPQPQPPARVN